MTVGDVKGGRPPGAALGSSREGTTPPGQLKRTASGVAQQPPPKSDGYSLGGRASTGQVPLPARSVEQLLPDLQRLSDASELPARFASDLKLLFAQLNAPQLSSTERAQRVFEFFQKYAEAFVKQQEPPKDLPQKPIRLAEPPAPGQTPQKPPPEGAPLAKPERPPTSDKPLFPGATVRESPQASTGQPRAQQPLTPAAHKEAMASFSRTLSEHGFQTFSAGPKFGDGRAAALALLHASNLQEFHQLARALQIQATVYPPGAPPDVRAPDRPEARPPPEAHAPRELQVGPRGEMRVNPHLVDASRPRLEARDAAAAEKGPQRGRSSNKVLGSNLLWNVLHRVREDAEDSALLQDNWDKLTFGALLLLVFVALVVVALVVVGA